MAKTLQVTLRNKAAARVDFSQHVQLMRRNDTEILLSVFNEIEWFTELIAIPTPPRKVKQEFEFPLGGGGSITLALELHPTRHNAVVIHFPEFDAVDVIFSRQYREAYRQFSE